MAKKKLNGIHVDDPGNLEDSPRLVLINEECLYLIVNDGEELIKNIKQKTKSDVLQQPIDIQPVANVVDESISSKTMRIIVNQIGKHDFSCGLVVNNLKDIKPFSNQINRNHFNPILTRRE